MTLIAVIDKHEAGTKQSTQHVEAWLAAGSTTVAYSSARVGASGAGVVYGLVS